MEEVQLCHVRVECWREGGHLNRTKMCVCEVPLHISEVLHTPRHNLLDMQLLLNWPELL